MQTNFTAAQLADPDTSASEKILRACVHCGFCTATCPTYVLARRRARQPERAHLPDQGHAGERPPGDARGGQAYRPLPLVPVVHDDLSVGRQLHAPRRSRPTPYREDVQAAVVRQAVAARLRDCPAEPQVVSRIDVGGALGRAIRGAYARAAESRARARSLEAAERFACRQAAGVQKRGAADPSRCAI